jgi:hypothetical protein
VEEERGDVTMSDEEEAKWDGQTEGEEEEVKRERGPRGDTDGAAGAGGGFSWAVESPWRAPSKSLSSSFSFDASENWRRSCSLESDADEEDEEEEGQLQQEEEDEEERAWWRGWDGRRVCVRV